MKKYFLTTFVLCFSLIFSQNYSVGQTVTTAHQNIEFDICNGENPETGSTSTFKLADLNGDLNDSGQYYVFHIDMAASW